MINTINISLPSQLKEDAESLILAGQYASFSDLVRTAIRGLLTESKYDLLAKEAMKDYQTGRAKVLSNKAEIKRYLTSLTKKWF